MSTALETIIGLYQSARDCLRQNSEDGDGSLHGASQKHYQDRALDQNRSKGDRPYKEWPDERVKAEYVEATGQVRDADEGGLHLSPTIDRSWNLRQEWEARGNDLSELDTALEEAGDNSVAEVDDR